ncbi:MAG: glycine cleavage system aminomethyltransferase GcvT [Planctomycetota bacterium]|jgi:aminomethyltransferase
MSTSTELHRTPFHQFHLDHGAKMVEFAGWEMPLHYGSIIEEHLQVRRSGGIFDVSHMGRFRFTGRDARAFLDRVCTRQIYGMSDGQARYSLVCNEEGGCRDDVLVYRISDHEYLMVCNAANRQKLREHFAAARGELVFEFSDETDSTAMIALQGPKVMELLSTVSSEIPGLKRYRFTTKQLLLTRFMISRTGYTGEDGVEVIFPSRVAAPGIKMLLADRLSGPDAPIRPVGLGARDSLRLEAAMALYGHEITERIDPISAGLNFAIKLDKGEAQPEAGRFIGQDALQRIAAEGPRRRLVGLALEGRRAARQHMPISRGSAVIGAVTSGTFSPTLQRSIAMGYVDGEHAEAGTGVEVDLGRATAAAEIVPLPFYKAG